MRIANVMFGRGQGGIEQAFLDYNEALLLQGHSILAITHPLAVVNTVIAGELEHATVTNYGNWDRFCARRLGRLYKKWQPDVMISHGNRALHLNHHSGYKALHVGITHNYHLKHFNRLDAIIAITPDLAEKAREQLPPEQVSIIPNMVRLPSVVTSKKSGGLPVIGAMGRMVPKKGFDLLIRAAGKLKSKGVEFRLLLGGEGPEYKKLHKLVRELHLEEVVLFKGWVEDKERFFSEINIFCLPSLHEPFGIVLLEAMAHGKPVVSFASEGPKAIIQRDEAWLVEPGDVSKLADTLEKLIHSEADQNALVERSRQLVTEHYALPVVSKKISDALNRWRGMETAPRQVTV